MNRLCLLFLPALCAFAVCLADPDFCMAAEDVGISDDVVIAEMLPGKPEEECRYFFHIDGPEPFVPGPIAVDASKRVYIMEELPPKVHVVDGQGNCLTTVFLDIKLLRDFRSALAMGQDGILCLMHDSWVRKSYLILFDQNGIPQGFYGPAGEITPLREGEYTTLGRGGFKNAASLQPEKFFENHDALFHLKSGKIVVGTRYARTGLNEKENVRVFDLENHSMTVPTEEEFAEYLQTRDTAYTLSNQLGPMGTRASTIGPDGHFYYFLVSSEKLEVHKVTLEEKK